MSPKTRGFASLSPERRVEIARKGGASVAAKNRAYTVDKELAKRAGRLGGMKSKRKKK